MTVVDGERDLFGNLNLSAAVERDSEIIVFKPEVFGTLSFLTDLQIILWLSDQ